MPFGCKARIARNSQLLRRFATRKLGILGTGYEFMNRSEAPQQKNERTAQVKKQHGADKGRTKIDRTK